MNRVCPRHFGSEGSHGQISAPFPTIPIVSFPPTPSPSLGQEYTGLADFWASAQTEPSWALLHKWSSLSYPFPTLTGFSLFFCGYWNLTQPKIYSSTFFFFNPLQLVGTLGAACFGNSFLGTAELKFLFVAIWQVFPKELIPGAPGTLMWRLFPFHILFNHLELTKALVCFTISLTFARLFYKRNKSL